MTVAGHDAVFESPSEPDQSSETFERLDPSSRAVLALADRMREHASQSKIHMEYLLIGIGRSDPDAVTFSLGEIGGIPEFEAIIEGEVKFTIPRPADAAADSISRMPPLSAHATAALIAADAAAPAGSARIESRHLLFGALTIRECGPVKALIDKGIATDLQPRVGLRRTRVELIDDRPAEEDELARGSFAKSLATRIQRVVATSANHASAYLINLNGPWGSGKTTLLNLMKREFESDPRQPWLVVDFNAWEHQHLNPPWWWMTLSVWEAAWNRARPRRLAADRSPRGVARWLVAMARWRSGGLAKWRWMPLVLSLAAGVLVIFGLGTLIGLALQVGGDASVGSMDNLLKLVASVASLGIGVAAVARQLQDRLLFGSSGGAEMYASASARSTARLTDRFKALVKLADRQIVVYIDDLDRCQPAFAVELLEGIQTLFVKIPVVYVVAADRAWIEACFMDRYSAFKDAPRERGRNLGALFIEKTFQLTAPVPVLSLAAREEFWATILRESGSGAAEEARSVASQEAREAMANASSGEDLRHILAGVERDDPVRRLAYRTMAIERLSQPDLVEAREHELIRYAALLEPNPRAMKRFVNTYAVEWDAQVLAAEVIEADSDADGRLALWTILQMRWPELVDELRFDVTLVDSLVKGSTPKRTDASVAALFADDEVRRVVTGDGVSASLDKASIAILLGPTRRARQSRSAAA